MSTIYKAESLQATDGRSSGSNIVALKVTSPSSMLAPHNSEREARILYESRHKCVIPLLETFWRAGGQFILVFPFLAYDLEALLREDALDTSQSLKALRSLFEALAHLHGFGIIHRDVKPSNILLRSKDGPVYLADFGIAWSPNDTNSEPPERKITDVGTTSYRPPELLFGHKAYDTSLDIWAAGCVAAEIMRAGHQPLFDAGELGSELALIKSMFSTLGTPNDTSWPVSQSPFMVDIIVVVRSADIDQSARKYPDWGKMRFYEYPAKEWTRILGGVSAEVIDFVRKTVCYESTQRLTAGQVSREHV
jgi:serine/threonine protein kinase